MSTARGQLVERIAPGDQSSEAAGWIGRARTPRRMIIGLLGEYAIDRDRDVRAAALIGILQQLGVSSATTRATLERLEQTGVLEREKRGRENWLLLTAYGRTRLDEASQRIRTPADVDGRDRGWTLVTFSIPERNRPLRHRLRARLAWEGFAPVRDGLWLAPGTVDPRRALEPLQEELSEASLMVFRAEEVEDYPLSDSVRAAWDIGAIRAQHASFIQTWSDESVVPAAESPLILRTALISDWVALQRADPRLPAKYLTDDWPAHESLRIYRALRSATEKRAAEEFAQLNHDA